jgi:pimeloyl-ACP methyl ester carboxylesterase
MPTGQPPLICVPCWTSSAEVTSVPDLGERRPELAGWRMNPDRTLIAVQRKGDHPELACWRLRESGEVSRSAPVRVLPAEPEGDWRILSWAAADRLARWRHRGGRAEVLIENVEGEAAQTRYPIMGRPVHCLATSSGRIEIMVAVPLGDRTVLYLLIPESDSYLPVSERGESTSVGAWDAGRGVVVLNVDQEDGAPGVRVVNYRGGSPDEIPVSWPPGVRPLSATGYRPGIVGLTGTDESGLPVPGIMDDSTTCVRWLTEHAGYSCVDVDPAGERLLTVHAEGQYRMMNLDGTQSGELLVGPGVESDLRITGDGKHVIGCFQSPALPPHVTRWNLRTGRRQALDPRPAPTGPDGVSWELQWISDTDGRHIPEWVFSPGTSEDVGTVLYLHGGPGGQLNQIYEPVIAALAGAGWTVRGMNYPGSSGYGPRYRDVVIGDWGGADAASVERRLRSLHEQAGGRPVCLYGQSYGGYLALLAAAAVPGLLSAVAVWAPVTDLPRLLAATAGTQRQWLEAT